LITEFSTPSLIRRQQRASSPLEWNHGLGFRESMHKVNQQQKEKQDHSGTTPKKFFFDQQVLIAKQTYQIQKLDYRIFTTFSS
jgi:hypothetical protein